MIANQYFQRKQVSFLSSPSWARVFCFRIVLSVIVVENGCPRAQKDFTMVHGSSYLNNSYFELSLRVSQLWFQERVWIALRAFTGEAVIHSCCLGD